MAIEATGRKPNDVNFGGLALLDDLIRDSYEKVKTEFKNNPRLGDWLKMVELRVKLSSEKASNRELWHLLEEVRRDILKGEKPTAVAPKTRRRSAKNNEAPVNENSKATPDD